MHTRISHRYVDLSVAKVADEAFASGIKEGLRVLRFRSCFEDFLVIKNDGTVS